MFVADRMYGDGADFGLVVGRDFPKLVPAQRHYVSRSTNRRHSPLL